MKRRRAESGPGAELAARLERGLAERRIDLEPDRRERLLLYSRRLLEWGGKTNLVGPSVLADPVPALLEALEPIAAGIPAPARLVDLGSGGGLPAIPLAIGWGGRCEVTLVEPRERRWAFLSLVLRELGLPGVARRCRWEELAAEDGPPWDALSSRALGGQAEWIAGLSPRLSPGARLILFVGEGGAEELRGAPGIVIDEGRPLREPGHLLLLARIAR